MRADDTWGVYEKRCRNERGAWRFMTWEPTCKRLSIEMCIATHNFSSYWMREEKMRLSFSLFLLSRHLKCNFMLQWKIRIGLTENLLRLLLHLDCLRRFIPPAMVSKSCLLLHPKCAYYAEVCFFSCDFCLINNSCLQARRTKSERKKRPSRIVQ